MPREAKVGGGVWHEYILLLKKKKLSPKPLCRVAAVVLLGEAWSGKPGFESHRQPLCLFGGVGRKRLAPSSCTGGVHKGSVGDVFKAFPTGGCWTVV